MENKNLNEKELEHISGGQAVLPLLSGTKQTDEQILGVGYFHATCPSCGFRFPVPQSQQGRQTTCQECGTVFTVK